MSSVSDITLTPINNLDEWFDHNSINAAFDIAYANIEKIAALVSTTRIGQANFAFDAPVSTNVREGQPVFYNTQTNRFERSQLTFMTNANGRIFAGPSSEAWGLCTVKCAADRAHILLSGLAKVSLFESTGLANPAGKFYLSLVAGRLENSPHSSLVVPVLLSTGAGEVLFRPWFADTFPRYTPSLVNLVTSAAGTVVVNGGTASISNPNPNIAGWLPAAHSSFNGNAPIGARFGYNMSADVQLSGSWPPIAPSMAKIYYESGGSQSQGARIMLGNDAQRVIINEHGIWWMINCESQTPWNYAPEGVTSGTCPRPAPRKMTLETDFSVQGSELITGLSALRSNIPWIKFFKTGTSNVSTVGDLTSQLDTSQLYQDDLSTNHLAFKSVANNKIQRGPVVTSLKAKNSSVVVSGGVNLGSNVFAGQLELEVVTSMDFDLLPNDTQLFGATTEAYSEQMAIGLPATYKSSFVNSFHIPTTIPTNTNLRFYFWVTGQQTYTLPANIQLFVRVFSTPNLVDPVNIPTEVPLVLNYTPGTLINTGQYRMLRSNLLQVSGGNTVYLRTLRNGDTDGISSEVHFLKQFARFEA